MIILKHSAPHRDRTRGDQPGYRFPIYPVAFQRCKILVALPRPVNYAAQFLSPNKTQFLPLRLTMYKYPCSRPLERLAVKIFSHPTMRVGSHSFILPQYILVFALRTPRVDRFAVNVISHPAVRMGNHSFITPHNIRRARTIVWLRSLSHPAVRMGNQSFITPHNIYRARTIVWL